MAGLQFFVRNDPDGGADRTRGCGADVDAVNQAWQRAGFCDALKPVIVDFTFIADADEHGRTLFTVMHRFGARIVAQSRGASAIA